MKSVRIRSFSGPYFPAFGPDAWKNTEYGHFSHSVVVIFKFVFPHIIIRIEFHSLTHSRSKNLSQKQLFEDVLQNRCFSSFHKFYWKTPLLESIFNKVAGLGNTIFYRTPSVAASLFTSSFFHGVEKGNIRLEWQSFRSSPPNLRESTHVKVWFQ